MTRRTTTLALVALAAAALCLALAPLAMPEDYSWVTRSISESAAQGIDGAWVARTGFLLMGLGTLLTALASADRWRTPGSVLLGLYGVLMMSAAALSTRSWRPDAAHSALESTLHSTAATAMGFCYALGVLAVLLADRGMPTPQRVLGVAAVASSVAVPVGMLAAPSIAGVLQRAMFALALLWLAIEAHHTRNDTKGAP
jgi:hypothetical protein